MAATQPQKSLAAGPQLGLFRDLTSRLQHSVFSVFCKTRTGIERARCGARAWSDMSANLVETGQNLARVMRMLEYTSSPSATRKARRTGNQISPGPTDRIENLSVPASCATNLWTHAAHKCCRRRSFRAAFPPNLGIGDCPNSIPTSYAFENVRFFRPFRAQDPQRNPPGAETSNHDSDISLF